MRPAQRNGNRKCAAMSIDAIHAHRSTVDFHQFHDQRQANPGAFMTPPAGAFDAVKAVEDSRQFMLRYARTRVANGEFGKPRGVTKGYRDLSLKGELEGVRHQVQHD